MNVHVLWMMNWLYNRLEQWADKTIISQAMPIEIGVYKNVHKYNIFWRSLLLTVC